MRHSDGFIAKTNSLAFGVFRQAIFWKFSLSCENLRWIAGVAHGSTRLLFLREGVRCATAHCSVGRLGRGGAGGGRSKNIILPDFLSAGLPPTDVGEVSFFALRSRKACSAHR